MDKSDSSSEISEETIDRINFIDGYLLFDRKKYEITSLYIDNSIPEWMSPETVKLDILLNQNIFYDYKNFVGNYGWNNTQVEVFLRMLEGEPYFELGHGNIVDCFSENVVLLVDLIENTEIVQRIKGIHNTELTSFKHLIDLDKKRREELKELEEKKPYLKRFRISLEED